MPIRSGFCVDGQHEKCDLLPGCYCECHEQKGLLLFEEGNLSKYQAHLDRHAGNAACNYCSLALRYKVRELENRIKELEEGK